MKKIVCVLSAVALVLLYATGLVYAKEEQPEEPDVHARAALLMDADTGRVLYEKDGYTPYAVASTTKILTAVLVLEAGVEEEFATVSANAAAQPKVKLYVKKGERYKVKDLLYSLLLESHNDTAVVLAEHISGSTEAFAKLMNKKAEEIGCENAYFITPNGLDAQVQGRANQASAYDMALITAYALKNERFLQLIATKSHSFTDESGKRHESVNNANRFLQMYEGALGVKTGFTNLAGYCFVGAADTACGRIISVVLGSDWPPHQTQKWKDTKVLMEYGSNRYKREVLKLQDYQGYIGVGNATVEEIPIFGKGGQIAYPLSEDDVVKVVLFRLNFMDAPIRKGEKIGWKRIYVNDECVMEMSISTRDGCREKKFCDYLHEILHRFYI